MANEIDITEQVLIALRVITRAIDVHSKKLSQICGLTAPQLIALKKINKYGQLTTGQLSKHINLSQATVSSLLDRLEKKGFIFRKRDLNDKRKVYVSITESGIDTINKSPTILQEKFLKEFNQLEDWEQSLILSSLQRVGVMMGEDKKSETTLPIIDANSL